MIHGDPEAERWGHARTREQLHNLRNTMGTVRLGAALIRKAAESIDRAFRDHDEARDVTRTKPKAPKIGPEERQVQAAILDLLVAMQFRAIRTNAGTATRPKKDGGVYTIKLAPEGWPDITGMVPGIGDGRLLLIEVKKPGEWPTPQQIETMRGVNDDGGVAFWVADVEKCHRTLVQVQANGRIEMEADGSWYIEPRGTR